ncbi:hypothetical protein Tco_1403959 [Tanacetum coccineum]
MRTTNQKNSICCIGSVCANVVASDNGKKVVRLELYNFSSVLRSSPKNNGDYFKWIVKTAFQNGKLWEDVYVIQRDDLCDPDNPTTFTSLRKLFMG